MKWLALLCFAGCVDTASDYRCAGPVDCMIDGSAGRCEPTGHCSFPDMGCGPAGFRYHASAGTQAGICVLSDFPEVEVPPFDLNAAHDNVHSSCTAAGTHDVSFELTNPIPQTLVFDTGQPGGTPVAIAIHGGPCPAAPETELGCSAQSCGPLPYATIARDLMPGTYCVVVEQAATTGASGTAALRVFHGGRDAIVLDHPQNLPPQSTCGAPVGGPPASCSPPNGDPALAYVMLVCPGPFDLTANITPSFEVAASLHQGLPMGTEVDCKMGSSGLLLHAFSTDGGPYWLTVQHSGAPPACGMFSLMFMLGPH